MKGFAYFEGWLIEGRIGILKELEAEFLNYDKKLEWERAGRIRAETELATLRATNKLHISGTGTDDDVGQAGNAFGKVHNENASPDDEFKQMKIPSGQQHASPSIRKRKAELGPGNDEGSIKKTKVRWSLQPNIGTLPGSPPHEREWFSPVLPSIKDEVSDAIADYQDVPSEADDKLASSVDELTTHSPPVNELSAEEIKSLKDQILVCLWDRKKAVRATGLDVAASSPHINEVLPTLIKTIYMQAMRYYMDPELSQMLYRLRLLESLSNNPTANLIEHITDIKYISYTCTTASQLPGRPERKEHWEMRTLAASLLGKVFQLSPQIMEDVKEFVGSRLHNKDRPICVVSLYGMMLIMKELGNEAVQELLIPKIGEIGARVEECLTNPNSSQGVIIASQKIQSLITEVASLGG